MTADTTFYIDIKSEFLRDILRTTLKDAHSVVTNRNKLSVSIHFPCKFRYLIRTKIEQNVLYHYLPELKSYQSWNSINFDGKCAAHIGLLVDYMKQRIKI